jgi:Domain of unknown function (DUF4861)
MSLRIFSWSVSVAALTISFAQVVRSQVTVTVKNPINLERKSETVTLRTADLKRLLPIDDIRRLHVRDQRSGQDLLMQVVDEDGNGTYDELIFQTDLDPNEIRTFQLTIGDRRIPTVQEFKAYGRFVREREDDFAWENDKIAHRMYGEALETWPQEPLTSSAVDVWVKRVPRLVINDWYMVDDYHRDHGEGGDFYSAGNTRGCGGNGIWTNDRLYPSANFRNSRVLANGPIRLIFELTYPALDAGGARVSEVKRISLDAGQNFDHFESRYKVESGSRALDDAIGIRKGKDATSSDSRETGILRAWETLPDNDGQLGCAVIVDPANLAAFTQDGKNFLAIVKMPADRMVSYYAGFGWSQSGFPTAGDWEHYVSDYAKRVKSPVIVTIAPH